MPVRDRGPQGDYRANAAVIDRRREPTLEFGTGDATHRVCSRAKIIEMIFYVEGGGRGSRGGRS